MILKFLEVTSPMMSRIYDPMVERFEGQLRTNPYITGESFTAADVLFASAVQWGSNMLPKSEGLEAYLARLIERPAYKRALEKEQP